jgi:hypothetical protein
MHTVAGNAAAMGGIRVLLSAWGEATVTVAAANKYFAVRVLMFTVGTSG